MNDESLSFNYDTQSFTLPTTAKKSFGEHNIYSNATLRKVVNMFTHKKIQQLVAPFFNSSKVSYVSQYPTRAGMLKKIVPIIT